MNKVLIIDDDKELCTLIKRSVLSENIEADICNTGKEGLKKLKEKEYQLVILDVMMPGMDGFETLEEIRKGNSLPILMFTSKNDSASKVRGLRAGADDYLTKPFSLKELLARLRSMARRVDTTFTSKVLTVGSVTLKVGEQELVSHNTIRLAGKESKMLEFFMLNVGKKLSTKQLFNHVWANEADEDVDEGYVFIYVSYLRQKLKAIGANVSILGEEDGDYQLVEM